MGARVRLQGSSSGFVCSEHEKIIYEAALSREDERMILSDG